MKKLNRTQVLETLKNPDARLVRRTGFNGRKVEYYVEVMGDYRTYPATSHGARICVRDKEVKLIENCTVVGRTRKQYFVLNK